MNCISRHGSVSALWRDISVISRIITVGVAPHRPDATLYPSRRARSWVDRACVRADPNCILMLRAAVPLRDGAGAAEYTRSS